IFILAGPQQCVSPGMLRSQQETSCNGFLAQQIRTFIQLRSNLKVVDTIVASVKEAQPGGKVKKGQVVYGVVVRAAMQKGRCDGSEIKFDDNVVVLVNKQGEPIGTRVFGPVPHELRKKKHVKIPSLAQHIA
ncbi:50S ribosomal protein HLP, mitochondrial-like protein, partial [Tanacetum coccineum]